MLFKDDLLAFYMLLSFSYVGISYLTAEIAHVSYCIFFFVLSGHFTSIKCLKAGSEVVLLLTLFWISCKISCSYCYKILFYLYCQNEFYYTVFFITPNI